MSETADPQAADAAAAAKETYAMALRDQMARAHTDAAVIATIDGEGQVAVTSPMGYGRRQVAAMLRLIADKIDAACDADDIPELTDEERPGDIPDGTIHLA